MIVQADSHRLILRATAFSAAAGALLILVMAAFGSSAGPAMASIDQPVPPETHAALLRTHAPMIIWVLAVDNLFLIAYTGAFIGAAALLWAGARILAAAGLGFALLTALLDLTENGIIIHLARAASMETGFSVDQSAGFILAISVIGQVKYAGAAAALVFFALGLVAVRPAGPRLRLTAVLLYLLFPAVNALAVVNPDLALARVLWMFLMLVVSALLLWVAGAEAPRGEAG